MKSRNDIELIRQAILEAARDAAKIVSDAKVVSLKEVADAAGQARLVVSSNASETAKALNVRNADGGSDHDTLVTLVSSVQNLDKNNTEKFKELKADIKEIKDGTANTIARLQTEKLDAKDSYPVMYKAGVETALSGLAMNKLNVNDSYLVLHKEAIEGRLGDHESRIRDGETKITKVMTWGAVGVLMLNVLGFLISKFWN